jgi:hypothetical protein
LSFHLGVLSGLIRVCAFLLLITKAVR